MCGKVLLLRTVYELLLCRILKVLLLSQTVHRQTLQKLQVQIYLHVMKLWDFAHCKILEQLRMSHFSEKVTLAAVSIGLTMVLNDVRPGNCCSLSYGFLSVAAVTEMKLQLKYLCAEQCQEFSSALCQGSGSPPPLWCEAAPPLRPSSELEWMRNCYLTKKRERKGKGKN